MALTFFPESVGHFTKPSWKWQAWTRGAVPASGCGRRCSRARKSTTRPVETSRPRSWSVAGLQVERQQVADAEHDPVLLEIATDTVEVDAGKDLEKAVKE